MNILYEDQEITVAIKPTDRVSEQTAKGDGFADLLAARNPSGYVGVIHRLDRGVGGVMVYARTPRAAAKLSDAVRTHGFQKQYLAVIHGEPTESVGTLRDLLFHDRVKNKTYAVDRMRGGVKEAILDYEVLKSVEHEVYGRISLVSIRLHTGRTHQIRAQFSSRGMPLVGDRKYGASSRADVALFSASISFQHPKSGKEMIFSASPEGEIWNI